MIHVDLVWNTKLEETFLNNHSRWFHKVISARKSKENNLLSKLALMPKWFLNPRKHFQSARLFFFFFFPSQCIYGKSCQGFIFWMKKSVKKCKALITTLVSVFNLAQQENTLKSLVLYIRMMEERYLTFKIPIVSYLCILREYIIIL